MVLSSSRPWAARRPEIERLGEAAEQLRRARVGVGRRPSRVRTGDRCHPEHRIIILLLIGSWQVSTGHSTPVTSCRAFYNLLAFPMRVVGFLQEMHRAVVSIERVDRVLATESAALGWTFAPSRWATGGELRARELHVRTGCPRPDGHHLRGHAGEVVAIVGSTGSGKTTLCDLISAARRPRLRPCAGRRHRHGHDRPALSVALVFQELFLFAESITDNISPRSGVRT